MGWSQRTFLTLVLLAVLLSTWAPAVAPGSFPVEPQELVLPGNGEAVTAGLSLINDSVILSATMDVRGSPSRSTTVTPASSGTTIAYEGGIGVSEPQPDYVNYLGYLMSGAKLDAVASVDAEYAVTVRDPYAYQLYLVDVEPEGIDNISVTWRGQATGDIGDTPAYGADLLIYNNVSQGWELVGSYNHTLAVDQIITGGPQGLAWQYVNHTLTGEDKVVLLVQTQRWGLATISTDNLAVTYEYLHYPRPRLDVGDDGMVDWGFGTSEATGAMGRVTAFDDGSSERMMTLPLGGGSNDSAAFLVPPNAAIDRAYVGYVPFPTGGQREDDEVALHAPAGGDSPQMTVTGIPLLAHQTVSYVKLNSVTKLNVTDQRQESPTGMVTMPIGETIFGPRAASQSFTAGDYGVLSGVDIYVKGKSGPPFTMDVDLRSMQAGEPSPNTLASASVPSNQIAGTGWHHVSLSYVGLVKDTQYAIVLMIKAPDPGQSLVLAINDTDSYPGGTAFSTDDLGGMGMWTTVAGDLAFRTYIDTMANETDASNLEILGVRGVKEPIPDIDVDFAIYDHEYQGRNWTFTLRNHNPFDVDFDWWAQTHYMLYAESPALDVGGDGTVEWSGENVSTVQMVEITEGLIRVVSDPEWPHVHVDLFGNTQYRVPINLSATSEGEVALRHLVVYWNDTLTTPDLAPRLNALKATLPEDGNGRVVVPLNITSRSPGVLNITRVHIQYDLPPTFLDFADVNIPEDGPMPGGPLELDTLVFDDYHNNELEYTVVRESGDENVSFQLGEGNLLSFTGPANWSGWSTFHVLARDGRDLENRSGTFNVTIFPVDDPPLVSGLPPDLTVVFGREKVVPITIVDNDTPLVDIIISSTSPRVAGSAVCGTVRFSYPEGADPETVTVTVSDGTTGVPFLVNVSLIKSDDPPVVSFPREVRISLDRQASINLTLYANDTESPEEELVWRLVSHPDELVATIVDGHILQIIPVATTEGQHVVVLSVTDPDDNTVTVDLNISLVAEDNRAPVIKRGADAVPAIIKVERGRKVVLNLALNDYWYDREDYNRPELMRWEVESLRPSLFTAEVDTDHRLTITALEVTGSGYMTLRLFDSGLSVSSTESVQVRVVEPSEDGSSWWAFAIASAVLVLVVLLLAAPSRRRAPEGARRPVAARAPVKAEPPATPAAETVPAPVPEEEVPGKILDVLVIHESTSLISQKWSEGKEALSEDDRDELIEMSTLFAQERFEGARVGAIKAFRFRGTEVLVAKGMTYFLAARCTGNQFEDVATELKRSIVNLDVGVGDQLRKWFPGQTVTALEDELSALINGAR